jgi:phospholipid-translocating ATPase
LDDYNRYKRDSELNSQKFTKITSNGKVRISSADIRVGDIIELEQNSRAPADMIILKSTDDNQVFIRTDQLDGETDWKLRKCLPCLRKYDYNDILLLDAYLYVDPPSRAIYEFNGVLSILEGENLIKDSLGLENTMWMNTVLASNKIIGCVIFTGKETRAQMNSSMPRSKVGLLDLELNLINKILFLIMIICSFIELLLKGVSMNFELNIITFFRFVVLLCSIIPISLRVNLDISKSINSNNINNSKIIPDTIVRNSTIPEELGRIEFLFSDKTGTLTKNDMIFKKLSMETDHFGEENINDLRMILYDECKQYNTPMPDLLHIINKNEFIYDSTKRTRRNRNKVIRDAITALALCNNVTPIKGENGIEYQSSSPDEVALVKYAESLNLRLDHRDERIMKLINSADVEEEYEILAMFPFSSDTKRMGIIVRNKVYGQIIFYLKGAENVIETFVKQDYKSYIIEHSEYLATTGLRTLVICHKLLEPSFYENWKAAYDIALTSMDNRKKKVEDVLMQIENNMDFLCVTGVEDQLQDEVPDTIEILKNAGIKIWMLTGDKIETATCIAISTGLKKKQQRISVLRDTKDVMYIKEELEKIRFHTDNVLIIDGTCLDIALSHWERTFFECALEVNILLI